VSASLGVITVRGTCDRTAVFASVDDALYQAKHAGRNRVVQARVDA
jgi:PleD family two-component response regulator